jgi:hypothetical protein
MGKKSESHLNNMSVFAFGGAVLLMCVGAGYMMGDANTLEEGVQSLILPSPIGLHCTDLPIKFPLN